MAIRHLKISPSKGTFLLLSQISSKPKSIEHYTENVSEITSRI